jgi:NarL family two-component system response regulator LiaR
MSLIEEKALIRVIIVDDHQKVINGLGILFDLFDDLELVGTAMNGNKAVQLCLQIKPDVVLMDLVMPEMDGVEATNIIRKQFPEIGVVGMTLFNEKSMVERELQAGACACLFKDASIDEFADAIRSAAAVGGERDKEKMNS